jgi:Heparinase II/III-like protein/Heparinase II/III N-terminus
MVLVKARTIWRLGPKNVLGALIYHLTDSFSEPLKLTAILTAAQTDRATNGNLESANAFRGGLYRAFGGDLRNTAWPPNWHKNVLTGEVAEATSPWWKKTKQPRGDIKGIWELSRFDWALDLAKAHIIEPKAGHLKTLNDAIGNWQDKNPPYCGPNWECGQETSLRLLTVLETIRILGSADCHHDGLHSFITVHLRRIALTLKYAIAQNNNHGTSEATALFVGGAYLLKYGPSSTNNFARSQMNVGQYWLENRVKNLIMNDGGFSQYSLTYHRLMLDTLAIAEQWRTILKLTAFSELFRNKVLSAISWFAVLIDCTTGDGPNLGSNDGAHVFRVVAEDYRDFRPSLARAQKTFAAPKEEILNSPSIYPDSGLHVFKNSSVHGFLKHPTRQFRPAHADLLHLDLWTNDGKPIVVDSGSKSYFDIRDFEDFSSIAHHNTIEFDNHEPMRRWSRFLFLDWLSATVVNTTETNSFSVSYRDYTGAQHARKIVFSAREIRVIDSISVFKHKAVLRWHFGPAHWRSEGESFQSDVAMIVCTSNGKPAAQRLVEKQTSPTYSKALPQQCLEVEVGPDTSEILTIFTLR